jgi:hypothetical protein
MKFTLFAAIILSAGLAQASTKCLYKANKAFAAVSLLEHNLDIPKNPIEVLPETKEVAGEGTLVPVENFRGQVGDITSADVSMYKNGCEILKIEISYGE